MHISQNKRNSMVSIERTIDTSKHPQKSIQIRDTSYESITNKRRRWQRRQRRRRRRRTQYLAKSISMVYPLKPTRTDMSGLTKWSVDRCASFWKTEQFSFILNSFFIYIYIYIYIYICLCFFNYPVFSKKYIDGLPLETDTRRHFRTSKMISELVRIFL